MSLRQKSSTISRLAILAVGFVVLLLYYSSQNKYKDKRLNRIGFVNDQTHNTRAQIQDKKSVLNITNLSFDLKYFQLLQFTPFNLNIKCETQSTDEKTNSFLLINVNTKNIGLNYLNLLRTLTSPSKGQAFQDKPNRGQAFQDKKCLDFRIFTLKQRNLLFLNDQDYISDYVIEIKKTIQRIANMTKKKINILTAQQGSVFLLQAFTKFQNSTQFSRISKKIDKILLINLYNSALKLLEQPTYFYIENIKQKLLDSKQMLRRFNNLNFIMINTLKQQCQVQYKSANFEVQDILDLSKQQTNVPGKRQAFIPSTKNNQFVQDHFFVFKDQKYDNCNDQLLLDGIQNSGHQMCESPYLSLNKMLFIHSQQIFNIHAEFDNGQYFLYEPFLQIIGQFLKHNNLQQMNLKDVQYYFRYGQAQTEFPFEFVQKFDVKKCTLHKVNASQPMAWKISRECFKLKINAQFQDRIFFVYSNEGGFDVYSNSLIKIQPYDKGKNGCFYLLQKMDEDLIVHNPNRLSIHVSVGHIFSPSLPLTQIFSEFQILYMDQIQQQHTISRVSQEVQVGKFVVRTCPENILIFPDHFPVGRQNRQFLLQHSKTGRLQKFMSEISQKWIIFRNILFLTLLFLYVKEETLSKNVATVFLMNYLIFYYTGLTNYQNAMVISIAYICQRLIKYLNDLSSYIHVDRKKIFICMLVMFLVAFICQNFIFHRFNHWKMLLVFVIFFVNKENSIILLCKLYFLGNLILYGQNDYFEIIQMLLFLQCNQKVYEDIPRRKAYDDLQEMVRIIGLVALGIILAYNPSSGNISDLIDYYIRLKIVVNILEKMY